MSYSTSEFKSNSVQTPQNVSLGTILKLVRCGHLATSTVKRRFCAICTRAGRTIVKICASQLSRGSTRLQPPGRTGSTIPSQFRKSHLITLKLGRALTILEKKLLYIFSLKHFVCFIVWCRKSVAGLGGVLYGKFLTLNYIFRSFSKMVASGCILVVLVSICVFPPKNISRQIYLGGG